MASGLWHPAPVKAEAVTVATQLHNTVPGTWLTLTPTISNSSSPSLDPEQASPVDAKDSLFLSNAPPSATSSRHSSFADMRRPMSLGFHAGPDAAERRASNVALGRTAAFMCNNSN